MSKVKKLGGWVCSKTERASRGWPILKRESMSKLREKVSGTKAR